MNYDYIKKQSWYKNPEMAGHRWAAKTLDKVNEILKDKKLNRTKLQKYIISNSFCFNKDIDWHYFLNQLSNKYISHVKHMLKKLNKSNIISEIDWLMNRQGMLRTTLEKAMRVLAYKLNKKAYLDYAAPPYQFYGMSLSDAKKRAESLVKLMEKDLRKKWMK